MVSKNGCFIVFEGIDGSGKSTQISLLKEHIEEHSINCMTTMEPSNGPIGTLLRQFLSGRIKGEETTLTALFAADRLDHLNNPVNGICKRWRTASPLFLTVMYFPIMHTRAYPFLSNGS